MFSFTQSDAGKTQMRWPSSMTNTDRIDKVGTVALYEKKTVPTRLADRPGLILDGKTLGENPPYVTIDVQRRTSTSIGG